MQTKTIIIFFIIAIVVAAGGWIALQSVKIWNTTTGKYEYHDGVNWVTI